MNKKPLGAEGFLEAARKILEERANEYDSPDGERSMGDTVQIFNIYTKHNLSEADGYLFMKILKDVRQYRSPDFHIDSIVDNINYAALQGDALERRSWDNPMWHKKYEDLYKQFHGEDDE